ncbi:hypothetical protein CesoFtcFv8_010766 [Champsocephalus esox]|uniref:Uncharacterized protein n=1 Tax=Champsocephalus esox TaxID=159716 RepID=A0AAN8BY50_9TELE|nr:hypothetical protein CesoFtcFv8_010766 [Champsocephalus esox]
MSWIFLVSTTILHLCAPNPLAGIAANTLLPAFPPVIMLKYSISQLLSFTNSSTPSSISVIRHLGLLRRPRYIHRSTRRSFVYFQHGQSIASICSIHSPPPPNTYNKPFLPTIKPPSSTAPPLVPTPALLTWPTSYLSSLPPPLQPPT